MKIICVGRNYGEHARELGNEIPEEPVVFMKPETAVTPDGGVFYIPSYSSDAHFEAELIFRIGKTGKHLAPQFAGRYLNAVSVGIDFTLRDVQQKLKEKGLPWERAKAFDGSAAIGRWSPLTGEQAPDQLFEFSLNVNGELRQSGKSNEMIHSVSKLIAYISSFVTLKAGDIVFTGTPAGVGRVNPGDRLEAFLGSEKILEIRAE